MGRQTGRLYHNYMLVLIVDRVGLSPRGEMREKQMVSL